MLKVQHSDLYFLINFTVNLDDVSMCILSVIVDKYWAVVYCREHADKLEKIVSLPLFSWPSLESRKGSISRYIVSTFVSEILIYVISSSQFRIIGTVSPRILSIRSIVNEVCDD